jgi:hypothetical protein
MRQALIHQAGGASSGSDVQRPECPTRTAHSTPAPLQIRRPSQMSCPACPASNPIHVRGRWGGQEPRGGPPSGTGCVRATLREQAAQPRSLGLTQQSHSSLPSSHSLSARHRLVPLFWVAIVATITATITRVAVRRCTRCSDRPPKSLPHSVIKGNRAHCSTSAACSIPAIIPPCACMRGR